MQIQTIDIFQPIQLIVNGFGISKIVMGAEPLSESKLGRVLRIKSTLYFAENNGTLWMQISETFTSFRKLSVHNAVTKHE